MWVLIFLAVFFGLLYTRRCPIIIMRVWFTLCLVLAVLLVIALTLLPRVAADKNILSRRLSERWACCVCGIFLGRMLLFLSPHIHVRFMEDSLDWCDVERKGVICSTHTSFFDTNVFLRLASPGFLANTKAFAKKALWDVPLLGLIMRACGHLPVYFTSEESSSFAVDKQKQMLVAAETEAFLADGGVLCFFPEGVLNRTPETLRDFRHGSFNMILKHHLPIHYVVLLGCNEVWDPVMKGIPGFPADLFVYIGKYEYEKNAEAGDVAKGLRDVMQKHLDDMIEKRRGEQYVAPIKKYILGHSKPL